MLTRFISATILRYRHCREIEAWNSQASCPRSHSSYVWNLGFEPRSVGHQRPGSLLLVSVVPTLICTCASPGASPKIPAAKAMPWTSWFATSRGGTQASVAGEAPQDPDVQTSVGTPHVLERLRLPWRPALVRDDVTKQRTGTRFWNPQSWLPFSLRHLLDERAFQGTDSLAPGLRLPRCPSPLFATLSAQRS